MLVVKETSSESGFGSLMLPLSNSSETRQKVKYAAAIAQNFNSTIHLLLLTKAMRKSEIETLELFGRQTERYLAERGIKYTVIQSFGENIVAATERYSKKVKANIVFVTVNQKYSYFWNDRYVKKWIENGEVSLMTVPTKKPD
jgi:hypothetical protein